jgi:E3 ubiquitin-protein ligase RNF11|uniref:RING-type domain-containing protein n=1 Tax=Panagrolaimus sp. PS1159 TaxID=55785 RepID=A0AC35G746_9BILA
MGNCLQILYHRTFTDDRARLSTAEEEIMGASQSSSSSSSSLSSSSQQENNYERYAAAARAAETSNIINQHLSRNIIRVHQRSERPRPTSAYVNELYVSSTLTGNDEAQMHNQLEEKRKARARGLLQQLRIDVYVEGQVEDECAICMIDFEPEEEIRRLPCNHVYHVKCIDDWLIRSFTCPSCMEPVDSALLAAFTPKQGIDISSLACSPASYGSSPLQSRN